MSSGIAKTVISLLIISMGFSLQAQQVLTQGDSIVIDSIVKRIKVVMAEYNENPVDTDTSDYEHHFTDAVDINLQIASSKGDCNEVLRLVAHGADINNFIGKNARPLHYAVAEGEKAAAEILLLLGASPDLTDIFGNTPLTVAVRANNLEISELLIRYGAGITVGDNKESTPLHHSSALGFFYLADMLLYYDSPLEVYDTEGNTPLMISVWAGYYDITDLLLSAGANPNAADKKGFTPLMMAAQNGDTLLLRMLLNRGADLYATNSDGLNALSTATRNGRKDAVVFLLENGSLWELRSDAKMNPLNITRIYGLDDLIPLLTDKGFEAARVFAFEELIFYAGGMTTTHHSLLSGSISLREPRMKAGITAGADFNPSKTKLLVKQGDNLFYQYRITTSVIYAGFFKEFNLAQTLSDTRWSLVTSLSAGWRIYSFYEGSSQQPGENFCIIPSARIEWSRNHLGMKAGVSYIKMPFYKVAPVWVSLGCSYNLYREIPRAPGKKVRLYSYD